MLDNDDLKTILISEQTRLGIQKQESLKKKLLFISKLVIAIQVALLLTLPTIGKIAIYIIISLIAIYIGIMIATSILTGKELKLIDKEIKGT